VVSPAGEVLTPFEAKCIALAGDTVSWKPVQPYAGRATSLGKITSMLTCQKHLFSLPPDITYLNSAYMGPLSMPVQEASAQGLQLRAVPSQLSPSDFFEPAERVRKLAARLVNAQPEHVAIVPTAAWGTAIVAHNMQPVSGQNVVLLDEQFPSNVLPWRKWTEQGVEVRYVKASSQVALDLRSGAWSQAVLDAIDSNTCLVAIEQAHWTDGSLFDLVAIGKAARAVGAMFVVDVTQTIGAYPIDAQAIGADALIAHCYKSMLCHYGLGFAVLGERLLKAQPFEQSWLLRKGAEDFSRLVDYQDDYAPGARRFDTSVRANPVLILALEAALELSLSWGAQNITDYTRSISRRFCSQVPELGLRAAGELTRAGNIFGLHAQQKLPLEAVRAALAEQKVYVSVRGAAIRVSPHMYNDEADFDRLYAALKRVLKT
jgi:selenocysteine lyase/cysteine desulfurase